MKDAVSPGSCPSLWITAAFDVWFPVFLIFPPVAFTPWQTIFLHNSLSREGVVNEFITTFLPILMTAEFMNTVPSCQIPQGYHGPRSDCQITMVIAYSRDCAVRWLSHIERWKTYPWGHIPYPDSLKKTKYNLKYFLWLSSRIPLIV